MYTAPNEEFHHDPPFAVGRIPETSDEARLTVDEEERTPPVLFTKPVARPLMTIFPVSTPPRVKDCLLVVARLPAAVRNAPPVIPVPAEIEAVGI